MPIIRHQTKSCCGSKNISLELDRPITKNDVQKFVAAGYLAPKHFFNSGVFYVQKGSFVATTSFGRNIINTRCKGHDCFDKLSDFERVLGY